MSMMLVALTILAYGTSFGLYVYFLYTGRGLTGQVATLLLGCGVVAHYFALLERSRGLHTVPYHDLYGSMSLFGWLLALTYLGLELYHRQSSVGAFVMPFILVFFLAAHLAPADRVPQPTEIKGMAFAFHVTLSILAYAAFGLSCVLSLLFVGVQRRLKSKKPGAVVWRLPSLDLLEKMSRNGVLIGLLALVSGTVLGFVWVDRLTGQFWYSDPKYIVTLLVIALYVAYFFAAGAASWRGARASKLCIFNFLLVVFSFTFVNLHWSQAHRYF